MNVMTYFTPENSPTDKRNSRMESCMRGDVQVQFGEGDTPYLQRSTVPTLRQQAAAVAARPVLTATSQQTLWPPMRDADRLATSRPVAGPLPTWGDRCVATAPARICPCGSSRVRWDEDEAT